jgi:hypothetical protein
MRKHTLAILVIAVTWSMNSHALTTEEAYRAIPHQRTVFDATDTALPKNQAAALQALFTFVDAAIVLRVEGLQSIRNQNPEMTKKIIGNYKKILGAYSVQAVPTELENSSNLFIQAVQLQQKYFENKVLEQETRHVFNAQFTSEVSQSSQLLHQAYDQLLQSFPTSSSHNKQAYYDYPCALDFQ